MVRTATQMRQESGEWSPVRAVLDAPMLGELGSNSVGQSDGRGSCRGRQHSPGA